MVNCTAGKKMHKILIVDDEPTIGTLLSRYLRDAGYQCRKVKSVPQAKEVLQEFEVDLLLTDINMPGENGIDLIRYVKKHYPDIAIVVVSVIDNPDAVKKALALDVYGYIVKPFTRNLLLIGVENALRRQRLELQSKTYQQDLESRIQEQRFVPK